MTPEEVSSNLAGRPDEADKLSGHWFLCGDISDRFYELARDRSDLISYRVSAFHTPDNLSYSIITHQLQEVQHRFVLPLYEARMAQCLGEVMTQPLAFSLGNDASDRAIIQMPPMLAPALTPLLALHLPLTPQSALLAVDEFPRVLAAACELEQVPSLFQGCTVRELSVSALFPQEAVTMAVGGTL